MKDIFEDKRVRILNAPFPTMDERDPSTILTLRLSAHVEQVVNK